MVSLLESVRKKVIGKPCEGKLHARFDEGVVGESPLLYSARLRIEQGTAGVSVGGEWWGMLTKLRDLKQDLSRKGLACVHQ